MSNGVGVGVRVGARAAWRPEKLVQPGDSWLLTDLDGAGGVTTHTEPDVSAGWAGADWAGAGLGPYTHTADIGHTAALAIAALIVGCRYLTRFTVSGRTAGTVTYYAGATAGAARSTNATFTEELTCTTNTSHSFVPTEDFDGVVTVSFVRQMSSSALICKGNLGNLAQATAANMPWSSDADAPTSVMVNGKRVVYFDGVADVIQRSFVVPIAQPWHVYCVARLDVDAADSTVFDGGGGGNNGRLYRSAANTLKLYSGAPGPERPYTVGAMEIYEALFNGASSFLTVNGGAKGLGDAGASNISGVTLARFSGGSIAFMKGSHAFYFGINRILTDPERAKMNAHLKAYYAL